MTILEPLILQAPVCLAYLDLELNVRLVSPNTLELFNTSEDKILNQNFFNFFRNFSEEEKRYFKTKIKKEKKWSGEESFSFPGGKPAIIKWNLQAFTKPGEEHHAGYLINFSKREGSDRKFSNQLHREVLLDTILNTVEVGMVACDKKGRLTLFNRAAREWHGLPKKDIPQEEFPAFYNLYEPDEKTLFSYEKIPLVQVFREGKIDFPDMFIKPRNGKPRHITCNGARLYNNEKEVTGAVVALYDITARKEAQRKLKVSEKTFKGSFENAAIGMAITGLDGSCQEVNEALCQIMGYNKNEVKHLKFQDVTHPEDLNKDLTLFQELIEGKRDFYHLEKRVYHKTGKILDLFLSVSIVRDHQKKPLFFISQMLDVTEEKNAEKRIQSIAEITEDQNKRLKNFAHIVSHNLRSHSGNISMLLELMLDEDPQMRENEYIKMILAASNNLQETIQHLNDVSLINTSIPQNMQPLNLKAAVENTIDSLRALFLKEEVEVIENIPTDLHVLGVQAYLDSIILNFTTNAVKYSSPSRKSFVRFAAQRKNQYIELTIEDNGLGINLEKYGSKLFGMYKTFHKNENARGIGLFITKNQIDALGGNVIVDSEEHKGTTIKVYLKHAKLPNNLDC